MMNDQETAVMGWQAIADSLCCCVKTATRKKAELQSAGVIFYMKRGRPPQRNVYHFPSRLKMWTGLKSRAGEDV